MSFTGHAYVATARPASDLADLRLASPGAALAPAVLLRLAGSGGDVGVIDLTLVARGIGAECCRSGRT